MLKQKLLPPRSLWGKRGVNLVFSRLRCVQQDDIDVVGRMPDVILQSRVANYMPVTLEDLLYSDRALVEFYDKGLCILPIDDLWIFANRIERYKEHYAEFLNNSKSLADKITETIKYHGPLSIEDIESNTEVPIYWEDPHHAAKMLKAMWECGDLSIHHREGAMVYYDLVRRVLPKGVQKHMVKMPLQQYWDYKFIRRLNATGMLPTTGGGEVWEGIGRSEARAQSGRRLKQAGVINTVKVKESTKHYMYLAKDVPLLQAAVELRGRDDLAREVAFIAPLDNLLWDRGMILDMFNFQYTWEAEKTPPMRIYGFYVMPILYGASFVGRIDPFYHKKDQVLEIKKLFWEEGFQQEDPIFVNAFVTAMGDFMTYLGAQQLRFDEPAKPVPREIVQALKKGGIKIRR